MSLAAVDFFSSPAAMTALPDHPALAIHDRYVADERLRVPEDIISFINGQPTQVHLDL
jgi:hypothetical protein